MTTEQFAARVAVLRKQGKTLEEASKIAMSDAVYRAATENDGGGGGGAQPTSIVALTDRIQAARKCSYEEAQNLAYKAMFPGRTFVLGALSERSTAKPDERTRSIQLGIGETPPMRTGGMVPSLIPPEGERGASLPRQLRRGSRRF